MDFHALTLTALCRMISICLGCVLKSLITVELKLLSDFFFPLGSFNRIKYQFNTLLFIHLVCNNAVIIQISDD